MPKPDIAVDNTAEVKVTDPVLSAQVDRARKEKEEIIARYADELAELLLKINQAKDELANIEAIFKKEYEGHFRALENKKEEMVSFEKSLNERSRIIDAKVNEFNDHARGFNSEYLTKTASLEADIQRNTSLLNEIAEKQSLLNQEVKVFEAMRKEVDAKSSQLEIDKGIIAQREKEAGEFLLIIKDTEKQCIAKLADLEQKEGYLQSVSANIRQHNEDVTKKLDEIKAKREENTQIYADIVKKMAENAQIAEETDQKLIVIGEMKNQLNALKVSLSLKEITLNRKEQTLAEREANIQKLEEEVLKKL